MQRINRTSKHRSARRGLTLYEVVLAIGIFLMGMAVISQLITTGTQASQNARLNTQAAMHAESLMNEIVSGAREMSAVSDQPVIAGDNNWKWSLVIADEDASEAGGDAAQSKLKDLTVTVQYFGNSAEPLATFKLRRVVRDPQMFIEAAAEAMQEEDDAAMEEMP